jgi:serine/threonine-protein kinase
MSTLPWSPLILNDRYQLEEQVATGGMGEVWRARDVLLDRTVAVKLLRREYADDAEFRERLRQEAKHAGLLAHPGVVRVYDYADGSDEDAPYLVMEYVDGPSLAEVLIRDGTLAPRRVLELVAEVAEALYSAHAAGLVHRDVKPANLLMCEEQVKVVDFGLARAMDAVSVTRIGLVMGTPLYMSPEQVIGAPATSSSDLYGLGVIAYECLTGRPPFEGEAMAIAVAHRDRPFPPLPDTVPAPVAELVSALAAKDPADRPRDGRIVAEWARRLLDTPTGPPVTWLVQEPAPERRTSSGAQHRTAVVVLALALAALALLGWSLSRSSHGTAGATPPSRQAGQGSGRIFVDPAAYIGTPTANAAMRLRALGLRVQIQAVQMVRRPPGTVTRVTPSGSVVPGTLITLYTTAGGEGRATGAPPTSRPVSTSPSTTPSGSTGHGSGGGQGGQNGNGGEHNKKPGHGQG